MRSSLLSGLGVLSSLNPLSVVSLVDSLLSELLVDLCLLHLVGEGLDLASLVHGGKGDDSLLLALGGLLELIGGGVVDLSLLGLSGDSGEKDQLLLVLGESSDILGLSFGVLVVSSMVNSNSDGSGEGGGESGLSALSEGESSSELDLGSVLSSLSEDGGSKFADGGDSEGGGLGISLLGSNLLVGGGVEEALDSSHPVLSKMGTLKDVVVFYHVAY